MADQQTRGGQKQGRQRPSQATAKRGTATQGAGRRAGPSKRQDQRSNPDDLGRQATNEQR